MDTWATSSLSPQIAGHWGTELFERVFPMDLRPQAHEIIRTWLFSTVVRSHFQFDSLPFSNALISGWVLDPDRKKMSKSIGNVVTPHAAARTVRRRRPALLGRRRTTRHRHRLRRRSDEDRPSTRDQDPQRGKFVLGRLDGATALGTEDGQRTHRPRPPLAARQTHHAATDDFEYYDYARALERTETFFWSFCDDYVEFVKIRAYGESDDRGHGDRRAPRSRSRSRFCNDCSRRSCPSSPTRCGTGGTTVRAHRAVAYGARTSDARRDHGRLDSTDPSAKCSRRFVVRRARPRSPNGPESRR